MSKSVSYSYNSPLEISYLITHMDRWGLPWQFSGKKSACSARYAGLIPGSGKSPGGGQGNPLQYCGESYGQILVGYSPQGYKQQDMTEVTQHSITQHIDGWTVGWLDFYFQALVLSKVKKLCLPSWLYKYNIMQTIFNLSDEKTGKKNSKEKDVISFMHKYNLN